MKSRIGRCRFRAPWRRWSSTNFESALAHHIARRNNLSVNAIERARIESKDYNFRENTPGYRMRRSRERPRRNRRSAPHQPDMAAAPRRGGPQPARPGSTSEKTPDLYGRQAPISAR
jgi:hypothetical protein